MRLSSKISLSFLPGTLIAAFAIGLLIYPSLESALEKPIGDNHLLIAQQMMSTIDRVLHERLNDIQIIVEDKAFLDYLNDKGEKRRRAASNKASRWLEFSGPWDVLMLANPAGKVEFSSDQRLVGQPADNDADDAEALHGALEGSTYYSDLVLSRRTGKPTIIFAAPVVDSDGSDRRIRGAVIGHFSWPVILEMLGTTKDPPYYQLYNRAGSMIAASDPRQLPRILRGGDPVPASVRLALRGKAGTSISSFQDGAEKNLVAYVPQSGYLNYKGSGWALTVKTPLEIAFAAINRSLLKFVVILSVFIGLSVLASITIIQRIISQPLVYFISVVREIAKGNLTKRIELSTRDEIGELAASFNQMVADFKETTVSKEVLKRSEERVRLLLDHVVEAIYGLDLKGDCTFANNSCLKLLGYKREEDVLGKHMHQLIHHSRPDGSPLPEEQCRMYQAFREEKVTHVEDEVLWRADGTSFQAEYWSHPIYREGKVTGSVVSFLDITERKRLELMLMQSEKLSAVGQLAAGVAHEINNPLGIILGFAQSAAKRITDSDALSLPVKSIEREALRCRNLVQNLLTFSRQSKAQMGEFDLNETIVSTLSIIEAQARVKSVEVVRELDSLPPLVGDKNQIQQVIINLCNNAIDAMPDGGKIRVRTRGGAAEQVVIEVEDEGPGVPREILDKIFNPFFTTKEVGKGTGLGLSLVYEIIQRHKGTVAVGSSAGRGAKFSIFLPAPKSPPKG